MSKPLLILLCLFVSFSSSALSLDELQQRFVQTQVLRADFEQVKKIEGLPQPLISQGKMVISQQYGLWWQQESPFRFTLLFNPQRMVQIIEDQPPERITVQENPQLFQFGQLLSSLFYAKKDELEKDFAISFQESGDKHWSLKLTPKNAPLDRIFTNITLYGDRFLNEIKIDDKQGDSSLIRFFKQQDTPNELSADEYHYFQQ